VSLLNRNRSQNDPTKAIKIKTQTLAVCHPSNEMFNTGRR
jgi:hypothetical protein